MASQFRAIRLPLELDEAVVKAANKQTNGNISQLIIKILSQNLEIKPVNTGHDWEVIAWNLFNITAPQLNYALSSSREAHDFFSSMSKYARNFSLLISINPETLLLTITSTTMSFTVQGRRSLTKIELIADLVTKIDHELQSHISASIESTPMIDPIADEVFDSLKTL